jgi:hypothetical protein
MNANSMDYKTRYRYKQKILKATEELIKDYTDKHSKALVTRFDLHYPQNYTDDTKSNKDISTCMAKLIKKYKRYGFDPSFIWAREQRKDEHPHFHSLLLLNGSKTKNPYHVFKNAEKLWSSTIGANANGLVHYCMRGRNGQKHENGIMLDRSKSNYDKRVHEAMRQASYIAKDRNKGKPNDGFRDFGMSRLLK